MCFKTLSGVIIRNRVTYCNKVYLPLENILGNFCRFFFSLKCCTFVFFSYLSFASQVFSRVLFAFGNYADSGDGFC